MNRRAPPRVASRVARASLRVRSTDDYAAAQTRLHSTTRAARTARRNAGRHTFARRNSTEGISYDAFVHESVVARGRVDARGDVHTA